MDIYDVTVIGAGPAGLAAGLSSKRKGANTMIIERENRPGGILKQCIHDGFGLLKFKERLSGPEYASRYVEMVKESSIPVLTSTFVHEIKNADGMFEISLVNSSEGVFNICSKSLVLANGCRERTSKQIFIHGSRPAGIFTAGTAQYFVNIMGFLPCKRCVILGSGDIGLIMARRLTLEGAEVIGVYEAKNTPSGLSRNIVQCLEDFSIPLHLSQTITRVFGDDRVEGVEISEVDEKMEPIPGSEKRIDCDGVILSVGLIPENEIAESLNIKIDKLSKGPFVDQNFMTLKEGIFSCGNALHVNDLVDYVTESGELAGCSAAQYSRKKQKRVLVPVNISNEHFMYVVPQNIDIISENKKITFYFRSREVKDNATVSITSNGNILYEKKYMYLKPPEMEKVEIDLSLVKIEENDTISIEMAEG